MGAPRTIKVGEVFNRLTVIAPRTAPERYVKCRCACGAETKVIYDRLLDSRTKSCGCLRREMAAVKNLTHGNRRGYRGTRTYYTWASMTQRCRSPRNHKYPLYGGRGITVCDRWLDFANFLADMGERPEGMTLDRIDNDGNYEPGNCRWATPKQQRNNQRPLKPRARCRRGHKYTRQNAIVSRDGSRRCRTCNVAWQRARNERLKQKALAQVAGTTTDGGVTG